MLTPYSYTILMILCLLQPKYPLDEAIHFLKPLQQLADSNMETHLLAFEIYHRKGNILDAYFL